jgi:hypothetical protein
MSFDWSQYLDVAQKLAEQGKKAPFPLQEARYRASISRAYYAVFGKARYHLRHYDRMQEPNPLVGSNGERINIHQYVRESFLSSSDKDRKELGLTLDRMIQNRNIADYDLHHIMLKNLSFTVQVSLKWAKEALATLDRLQKTRL